MQRIVLLLIPPLVLFALYFEGQHYEPSVIRIKEDPLKSNLTRLLPAKLPPFRARTPLKVFTRETLYEYIDGHAEYFISAGFLLLGVREYENKDGKDSVVLEVYRMSRGVEALGILEDEASWGKKIPVGISGYILDEGLAFVKGPYLIKIRALSGSPELLHLAKALETEIRDKDRSTLYFDIFPEIGRVIKRGYQREAFLGIPFLNGVYTVKVKTQKTGEITLFIMPSGEMKPLLDYLTKNNITHKQLKIEGKEIIRVDDRYEGTWYVFKKKDYLMGAVGEADTSILMELVSERKAGG